MASEPTERASDREQPSKERPNLINSLRSFFDPSGTAPKQDRSSSPVSESHTTMKRDFESAFPNLSPTHNTKRFRSHSPVRSVALLPAETFYESHEAEQSENKSPIRALLLEEKAIPDKAARTLEHIECCRSEIRRHLQSIKCRTPNGQIDRETTKLIADELMNTIEAHDCTTAQVIGGLRSLLFSPSGILAQAQTDGADSQDPTVSPPSSHGFFSPPSDTRPSEIATLGDTSTLRVPTVSPLSSHGLFPSPSDTKLSQIATPGDATTLNRATTNLGTVYESKSTQTEPSTTNGHKDIMVAPVTHHSISDAELWKRELELFRRPEPLLDRDYKVVKAHLRGVDAQVSRAAENTVTSTQRGAANSRFDQASRSESSLRTALPSAIATTSNHKFGKCDVIDILDSSDDEVEHTPARNSHRVGGGGIVYYGNGEVEYIPSDDDEEISTQSQASANGGQLHGGDGTNDDLPDYEEYEKDDNAQFVQGHNDIKSGDRAVIDKGGHDDGDYSNHFNAQHQDVRNNKGHHDIKHQYDDYSEDASLFVAGNLASPSFDRRGRASRNRGADAYREGATGRGRSRSPELHRTERSGRNPYRENRHYNNNNVRHGSPARPCDTVPYVYGQRRYMRDEPEQPLFYGFSANAAETKAVEDALQYQDRMNAVGEIPGPKSGLRLKLDKYIRDCDLDMDGANLETHISTVLQTTSYSSVTLDEDQALHRSWLTDKHLKLYKGFPLVEDIGFLAAGNYAKPTGDCYWRALAYTLQGNPARWDLIKAEHLGYLFHVLSDQTHPRHELYAKQLNTQFFSTHGGGGGGGGGSSSEATTTGTGTGEIKFKANLWQLLHMPHAWTPGAMQQITADLYNIHLVTFTYDSARNACAEEFRYPRVTVAATARFAHAPAAGCTRTVRRHAVRHPWRNDWTREVPAPVPRNHGCDFYRLRNLMGGQQRRGAK
ncbi:hypothetical protein F5Y19DRAFT_492889 [Xylariaceae sp. FL1651]|nr:hypothetical protein F5Y19DRAFT_492889 [Xylariaceae sp. FL1651]